MSESSLPKVFLSGGVHGDEPAGVHAIINFLGKHIAYWSKFFNFTIVPCVNPWGLINYTRGNEDGINLNRDFKESPVSKEVKIIQKILGKQRFIFTMDFHETWPEASRVGTNEPQGDDPDSFYLWELCPDKSKRVGQDIIKNVSDRGYPVCTWPKIYGDRNNNGVIWYPEDCGTECYAQEGPLDSYLLKHHTDHAFTIETPRDWPLENRVDAHLISLITALNKQLDRV